MVPQQGGSHGQDDALDVGYRKSFPQQGDSTGTFLGEVPWEVSTLQPSSKSGWVGKLSTGKFCKVRNWGQDQR